jgi:hypothetical protein
MMTLTRVSRASQKPSGRRQGDQEKPGLGAAGRGQAADRTHAAHGRRSAGTVRAARRNAFHDQPRQTSGGASLVFPAGNAGRRSRRRLQLRDGQDRKRRIRSGERLRSRDGGLRIADRRIEGPRQSRGGDRGRTPQPAAKARIHHAGRLAQHAEDRRRPEAAIARRHHQQASGLVQVRSSRPGHARPEPGRPGGRRRRHGRFPRL